MSGAELRQDGLHLGPTDPAEQTRRERKAAVRASDQIAAQHPHELDDLMPKLAGRELARNPVIAAGVLDLLDALGLKPDHIRRPT